jgi:hypothetical protein
LLEKENKRIRKKEEIKNFPKRITHRPRKEIIGRDFKKLGTLKE